jgi:hypothetical protein
MKKVVFSLVSLLALVVSATAFADSAGVKTDAAAKIQYEVPAGLTATTQGNITALDEPKKEVGIFIVRSDKDDTQKAMGDLDAVLSSVVKDVKMVGAPQQAKHNGMDAAKVAATCTAGGKPAKLVVLFLKSPSGKVMIVAAVVDAAKEKDWAPTIMKVMNSFKPAA